MGERASARGKTEDMVRSRIGRSILHEPLQHFPHGAELQTRLSIHSAQPHPLVFDPEATDPELGLGQVVLAHPRDHEDLGLSLRLHQ